MINLNNNAFDKQYIDTSKLYQYTTDYQIFKHYLPDYYNPGDGSTWSPLRQDSIPSFSVFYGSKNLKYMYKDFATGESGDCIVFVRRYYFENYGRVLSYNETILQIISDLKLPLLESDSYKSVDYKPVTSNEPRSNNSTKSNSVEIKVNIRDWNNNDKEFWKPFGITKNTLIYYNVYPITHIYFNDYIFNADNYSYAYIEFKDDIPTYKIYQPFNKKHKFINNNNYSVWEGWQQMDLEAGHLIITSSRKDVMSIRDTSGYNSISLQAESVIPKSHVVDELKEYYNGTENIYVLYDNDFNKLKNWGKLLGDKLSSEFNFKQIIIPSKYECKDYSDLVKKHGSQKAVKILNNLLY